MGVFFGDSEIDSEGQLLAAQAEIAKNNARYDEEARRLGFRNGDELIHYLRQKDIETGGTVAPSKEIDISKAMDWHPASIFNHISQVLKEARR